VSVCPDVSFQDSSLCSRSLANWPGSEYSAIHTSKAASLLIAIVPDKVKPARLEDFSNLFGRKYRRIYLSEQEHFVSQGSEGVPMGPGMCREDLRSCTDTGRFPLVCSAVLC
jgi:hypothetical protein